MPDKQSKQRIDDILTRAVGEFIDPDGAFRRKLENNPEKIVIKFGIDPTRPDIHIGHAVVLRKLRQFQDLGCKVVFLVGDYTGQIGDPTGKNKIRPEIQLAEIQANMKTYLAQVGKILQEDSKVFSWIKNSDWFTDVSDVIPGPDSSTNIEIMEGNTKKVYPLDPNSFPGKAILLENSRMQKIDLKNRQIYSVSFSYVLRTLRNITHSRLIARDMFKERINKGEELYMNEMLYPVLQGLDSHILHKVYGACDLEIGGTDQTFNMLMGRDVMKMYKQPEQAVMAVKIIEGTDGKEKMSKSLDNYIGITDEPSDMYGKVMSIPDTSIMNYFELCTFTPLSEVADIRKKLTENSANPKDIKMSLARQIVSIYHGEAKAKEAEENFEKTFAKGGVPDDVLEIQVKVDTKLVDVLLHEKIVTSKTEFRRLVTEGAITDMDTNEKIKDIDALALGTVYKIGKHRFLKLKF
ncbi:MAG TPA: tyrosine--tRNA ligase [Candidatus Paceibacterota bacterium]|jgi:tyrosyl-tRNA synthetase|nr:tyrosine--tRNA ligase [Candidatus Paceibacterota bacterium]